MPRKGKECASSTMCLPPRCLLVYSWTLNFCPCVQNTILYGNCTLKIGMCYKLSTYRIIWSVKIKFACLSACTNSVHNPLTSQFGDQWNWPSVICHRHSFRICFSSHNWVKHCLQHSDAITRVNSPVNCESIAAWLNACPRSWVVVQVDRPVGVNHDTSKFFLTWEPILNLVQWPVVIHHYCLM